MSHRVLPALPRAHVLRAPRAAALAAVIAAVLALPVGPAAANVASLANASGAPVLHEARFSHDIEFLGAVALIESTQVLANPTQAVEQAVYTFDLPVEAAVVGLDVWLSDGRTTSMAVVDSATVMAVSPQPAGIDKAPDVGLLRLVDRDVPAIDGAGAYVGATYELRVYPVTPGKAVTVTIKWMAPLRYDDGRLSLRIPARGDASNLVREQVNLRLRPPAGVRAYASVHGGGRLLGTRIKSARFTAPPRSDVIIDVVPELAPGAPSVWFASTPIRDDFGALAVSVMAPLPQQRSARGYDRAIVIADVSRSLDTAGLAATATLADALLLSLSADAAIETILFDHKATRVFDSFARNSADTRKRVARAIRSGELRNGSDLGQALELARTALLEARPARAEEPRDDREPGTLIAILSDAMTPVSLDLRKAMSALGEDMLEGAEIFSIILVPDGAPVPDTYETTLGRLASKSAGRVIAVRFGEADTRAKTLAAELSRPAPLRGLTLEAGSAVIQGLDLPETLAAGQGLVAVGFYRGAAPQKLALSASQHERALRVEARRDPGLDRAALPLRLVRAVHEELIPGDAQEDSGRFEPHDRETLDRARRDLVKSASQASTITPYSAIVAVDDKDAFALDRLALVRKWGPTAYVRMAPPPEREPGYQLRSYTEHARDAGRPSQAQGRRTGELDRDIVKRLVTTYVVPRARACYEQELRRDHHLRGSATVVLEIARGEVQYAMVERSSTRNNVLDTCVAQAAYSIQVPRVAQGDDPEAISLVRYPLVFRRRGDHAEVRGGKKPPPVDLGTISKDPLGGMSSP